jgi:hypothetical protein
MGCFYRIIFKDKDRRKRGHWGYSTFKDESSSDPVVGRYAKMEDAQATLVETNIFEEHAMMFNGDIMKTAEEFTPNEQSEVVDVKQSCGHDLTDWITDHYGVVRLERPD